MKHLLPKTALDDRIEIIRSLTRLASAETLEISNEESLPMWVVLKHWQRFERQGECLLFCGNNGNSYGHRRIEYAHRPYYVHRIAYALRWGTIPQGYVVRHKCDRARCVNPEHLIVGTPQDNIADMIFRGRNVLPPVLRGMNNPHATLTDEQVGLLRDAATVPGAKQRELAERFGVSQSTVWRLVHRRVRA
jgi:hypothetical protein